MLPGTGPGSMLLAGAPSEPRSSPPHRLDTRRRSRLVSCSRRIATKSLRRAARNTVVMIGAVFALAIIGIALFANALAPYPPDEQNFDLIETPPGAEGALRHRPLRPRRAEPGHPRLAHLALRGDDLHLHRDAGGRRARAHRRLSRRRRGTTRSTACIDVFFSVPGLLLAVGIAAMRGPGVNSAVIAIAIVYIPLLARVMRGAGARRAREGVRGGHPRAGRHRAGWWRSSTSCPTCSRPSSCRAPSPSPRPFSSRPP